MKKSKNISKKAPVLDFNEIKDPNQFEDLTAEYFRYMGKKRNNVKVEQSGIGTDGGRDILVTFTINDGIAVSSRKWVVQCKFYSTAVSKHTISDVNIPSLIHQYGADGYLLVCKNGVTSKVTEMFEDLNRNCKFNYSYVIWQGNKFINILYPVNALHQQYFPKYYSKIKKMTQK